MWVEAVRVSARRLAATLQVGVCVGHPEAKCADGSGVLVKAGKMP
ncbi:hypothetical protein ATK30_3183 [Amycolatopsis echigonensis]|uniref:Uncharacterized protein n=1 Tax=Amycolatopsis echigonensis TaxID=2576905 RepID=A0A2N3WER1_9PSEU|nr:hypothetical protein ATK30_3183 [Amycolatopsis niigatensis]